MGHYVYLSEKWYWNDIVNYDSIPNYEIKSVLSLQGSHHLSELKIKILWTYAII